MQYAYKKIQLTFRTMKHWKITNFYEFKNPFFKFINFPEINKIRTNSHSLSMGLNNK